MKRYGVVVGVIKYNDKILFLKRNEKKKTSPKLWQTVSGYIKKYESVEDAVLREVIEETGLCSNIIKTGEIVEVCDKYGHWITFQFLVAVDSDMVKIDSDEHTEYRWIDVCDFEKFDCISGTKE
ncbi:MAG: NUDIX hydrolase [DPANN group archaeon]|nr:NUDIX hydrolase [DPANN group archaeon]